MAVLLKQVFAFLRLLGSDNDIGPLSMGLCLGIIFGFSPVLSLQSLILLFFCFFFRVQLGAVFVSGFFFHFLAFAFDPLSDAIGKTLLEANSLRPLWVSLYNLPLVPLTRFNQSIVTGAAVVALILAVPMYFVFRRLIQRYREHVVARIRGTAIWRALQATAFYKWYVTYEQLTGHQ